MWKIVDCLRDFRILGIDSKIIKVMKRENLMEKLEREGKLGLGGGRKRI